MMLTVKVCVVVWILLRVVLAGLLRGVLTGLLWVILLLWTESRRLPPEWRSEETPLRLRGVLARVTLLLVLCGLCVGQIDLRNPPPPAHGNAKYDAGDDQETDGRDGDAGTDVQSIPAYPVVEADGGKLVEARAGELRGRVD